MNRRAFLFGSIVASTMLSAASAAPVLQVIYVGGWDCPPCIQWKDAHKARWLASPEFQRVTWIEVEAPKLKEAYRELHWPGDLKLVLDQIPRKSGTPRFLIVKGGRIVSNEFGVSKWASTMTDLKILLG